MSENKKAFIVAIILVLVISVISISLVACSKYVYADELPDNAILNFNQYLNPANVRSDYYGLPFTTNVSNGLTTVKGTSTQSWVNTRNGIYNSNDFVPYNKNHIYYLNMNYIYYSGLNTSFCLYTNNNSTALSYTVLDGSVASGYVLFKVGSQDYDYFNVFYDNQPRGTYDFSIQPILVDLSFMFGVGFEPSTLDEVRSYLPLNYYVYNTGTPISNEYIRGYQDGVSDTMNSYKYTVAANDSYNNLVPFGNNVVMDKSITSGKYSNTFSNELDSNGSKIAFFGFADNTLSSGSKLSLQGYCLQTQTSPEGVDVAVLVGQEYIVVGHLSSARESWLFNTISFTLPYASNGIYFIGKGYGGFTLADFVVEIETSDYDVLYGLAYQRGKDSVNIDKIKADARQEGYRDGLAAENPYTFRALFTSVFDVPIRAIFGYKDTNPYVVNDFGRIIYDEDDNPVPNPNFNKKVGGLLNFKIDDFGIDLSALAMSLITISIIVIIIKFAMGRN